MKIKLSSVQRRKLFFSLCYSCRSNRTGSAMKIIYAQKSEMLLSEINAIAYD